MSELTPNLKLFKYNTETDAKQPFSINDCMNANWDKIDASLGSLEICDIGMALYVDESKGKRKYLNGQIVDRNANTEAFFTRLKDITTLYPSLLCTEEEWQSAKTISAFGQVGRFVFNYSGDDIVSVRLPRVVNVQGLFDLQNLGMTVGQALPSHTHTRGKMEITGTLNIPLYTNRGTSGAFYEKKSGGVFDYGSNSGGYTAGFTASRNWTGSTSAPNYSGTVATGAVRQEAIQYPYFIQIATGSETENNIINEIELNNPSFFGDSKYVPTAVNNLSWLKSEGQNNPKGTYPSFYDWILENVNKGTKNFKGKKLYQFKGNTTETEGYTPSCSTRNPVVGTWFYGYAPIQPCAYVTQVNTDGSIVIHDTKVNKDYTLVYKQEIITLPNLLIDYDFYIDTDNETFRLPLLNGDENKLGKFEPIPLPAIGSDFSSPYVNGMYEVFASRSTNDGYLYIANRTTDFEDDNNTPTDGWGRVFCPASLGDTIYIGTSIPEGGQRFARYAKYIGNGSLYYYVGETVQNANLIDAGRIGEILPTKTDMQQAAKASMPSGRYIDLTLGAPGIPYKAPADGWVFLQGTVASGSVHLVRLGNPGICFAPRNDNFWSGMLPIRKGEQWTIFYSSFTANLIYSFYYAEGAQ